MEQRRSSGNEKVLGGDQRKRSEVETGDETVGLVRVDSDTAGDCSPDSLVADERLRASDAQMSGKDPDYAVWVKSQGNGSDSGAPFRGNYAEQCTLYVRANQN